MALRWISLKAFFEFCHLGLYRREAVHHPRPGQDDPKEPEHQDVSVERHQDAGRAELLQGQEGEGENGLQNNFRHSVLIVFVLGSQAVRAVDLA